MKRPLPSMVGRPFQGVSNGLKRPSCILSMMAGLALCGTIAASGPQSKAGEGPAPSAAAEAIRFRRVYVPADRLKDWPRDNARYVPMERSEFESLVRQAIQPSGRSPAAATPLAGARYTACLVGDSLVDGEALLDVAPLAASPPTVWLAPCNLAVSEATWLGLPPMPAVLATGEDGRIGIRGARPGQLQLKWSLRGRTAGPAYVESALPARSDGLERPPYGNVEFLLDLPACPANHLQVLLPKQFVPQIEEGVVAGSQSAGNAADRWNIEIGGRSRSRLRIVPRGDLHPARKASTLRESLTYEFSLHGLELSAQWALDVPSVAMRQLAVDLDPSLQLVTARYGGEPIPWSVVGPADPRKKTRVVLELPESFQGARRVLRLGAVAPSAQGRRWRLPAMRPQGVFWQEATATLIVPSPLTLDDLGVTNGRQTQTGPLPVPQSGQMAEIQFFSPDAAVDVVLAKPESPPEFDCGTAVELSGVDMAAEVTARFRLAEGERFQIDADVTERWTVDSVKTVPANALEDWMVLRSGSGTGTKARLSVRLAKALCAARPLKVIVQARHHYSPLGRSLRRNDLAPIEFHGLGGGRRLVSVRAAEAYQLRFPGDERLTCVEPNNLSPGDLDLFDRLPEGLVFADDAQAASAAIALEPQAPSFSAAIEVETAVADAGLREAYRIRCVPDAARVDRLLVQFSQSREVPLRWSFGPEEQDQAIVRPWKPGDQPGGAPGARGESFEIRFRRPRKTAFEVRAARTVPFQAPVSVALASVPESARQEGSVSIGAAASNAIRVEAHHLTPVPSEPPSGDRYSTVRSVFRYNPARDVLPASEAALVLAPQDTPSATPSAWAWSCRVESRFEFGGASHHLSEFRLQNSGRQRLLLALPEGLGMEAVRGLWVDGVKVPRESVPDGEGVWLSVLLPAEKKFPVVSVLLAVAGSPLGVAGSVEPVLPQTDVPVLQTRWTVWLPPGYESAVAGSPGETAWAAPRTVAQRLFGPLGRPALAPRFRPWDPKAWSQGGTLGDENAPALRCAESLFDRLGTTEQSSPLVAGANSPLEPSTGRVWAEQLTRAAAGLGPAMLIDHRALARAGVQGRSPIPAVVGETAADRGLAAVEQADLCILVASDAVLLTSAAEMASYRASVAPAGADSVWRVLPSPLAERMASAAESRQDPGFAPPHVWLQLPSPSGDPWTQSLPTIHGPTETLSWSAYRMELPAEYEAALPIVHSDTIRGLGWSVFVGVFALLLWSSRTAVPGRPGRPGTAVLPWLAASAALAALIVPEAFAVLPAAALWATLAAAGLRWVAHRRPAVAGAEQSTSSQRQAALAAVRASLMVFTAASAYAWCNAARGEPAGDASAGTVHQVLIPADDKQQPTGDKYYVPEALFSQLQTAVASQSDDRRAWAISSAVYRGILGWRTAPEQFAMEELRASYDIQVFGRQVRVRLPVGRTGIDVLPDGVTLEGRSIQPVWPDAGGNMAFDVAEPGQYRLELAVRPAARSSGGKSLVDWRIPRLAASRLELAIPPDAPNVEFPSALGAIVREPDPSRFAVALGPTDLLQMAWPEAGPRSPERHAVDVEQLFWMKLRPDSVVLDGLFSFRVVEGRMREIQLAVDPRLRYFPSANDRSPVARASNDPGNPQVLRLELAQPAADKLVVPMTFLLEESSGVGNYRLPMLDVLNARTTKRWLALSVDPSLEHTQAGAQQPPSIAVPTFVAAWGGAKPAPLAAWELSSPRPDWSVSTRPVISRIAAEQVLTLSLAARSVRIVLAADIAVSGDAVYQHRIAAPPEMEIERISVREEGIERVARWARAADAAAIVFLNGATRGKQQLTLRGRLPAPEQGKLPLPLVRLETELPHRLSENRDRRLRSSEVAGTLEASGLGVRPMEIRVFRDPAVQVEIQDSAGLTETEAPPTDELRSPPERLVKAFRVLPAEPVKAILGVMPNRPKIQAEQITWIRGEADAWQSEVELRFKVSGGLADEFRLEIPPSWAGPYKTEPGVTLQPIDLPGKSHRQLLIRPRAAVEGDVRITISSPLTLATNERPAAPKIVPQGVAVTKHWVILPDGPLSPSESWETRGLLPSQLPKDLALPPADRDSMTAYLAVGEGCEAILHAGDPGQGRPQIHLADLRIAWHTDGSYHALAVYDLDPAGLDSCPVRLSAGCRLVQVLVGGQSALAVPEKEDQWLIALGSTTLPQRIAVVFTGEAAQADADCRSFAMPSLGAIPVRQSIWTVAGPGVYQIRASEPLDGLTLVQHALTQVRNLAAILERLAEIPGQKSDVLARWYRGWAGHWLAARATVEQRLVWADASSESAAVRAEMESLEKRQATAAQRLGLSGLLAQVAIEPAPRDESAAIWLAAQQTRNSAIQWGTTADPAAVSISCNERSDSTTVSRLLAALTIAVLGLAAALASGRSALASLWAGWPYVGVAMGLAWWCWLTPSALGFGVTVVCVAVAAWFRWRKRAIAITTAAR